MPPARPRRKQWLHQSEALGWYARPDEGKLNEDVSDIEPRHRSLYNSLTLCSIPNNHYVSDPASMPQLGHRVPLV